MTRRSEKLILRIEAVARTRYGYAELRPEQKEAVRALTRIAAREWGPSGITVNVIYPAALTKRGMDFRDRDPERYARLMAERPIKRLGDPETDIAPIALFLATDDAQFLTGHVFYADGGAHLGHTS